MKRFSLVVAALLVSISFYGQAWDSSKPDKRFTFGVRAGVNVSTVSGENDDDYEAKSKVNFHAGLNLDINLVKSFAVETGVYYFGKGAEELNISDIQIPLLALFRLYVSQDCHIQLKGGVYGAYAVGVSNPWEKVETKKYVDVGAIASAGVSYKNFYFGLHYELGLSNAIKMQYSPWSSGNQWRGKNRNLAVSIGYDF